MKATTAEGLGATVPRRSDLAQGVVATLATRSEIA